MWVYPTTPRKGEAQGLLTHWSNDGGWALVVGEEGDLGFWLGSSGRIEQLHTGQQLRSHHWYFVSASFEVTTGELSITQHALVHYPLDSPLNIRVWHTELALEPNPESPLLIAAVEGDTLSDGRLLPRGVFNGKIDSPCLFAKSLPPQSIELLRQGVAPANVGGDGLTAAWDFSADIAGSRISDTGPHGLHGAVVNMPMRAVTGHAWDRTEHNFKHNPSQYGAIHFHDDDLEDADWQTDFEWKVPEATRSGFYAAHLRAGEHEDYIPFFVRPPRGRASARAVVLVPTMTYLAYANDRMKSFPIHEAGITNRRILKDPLDDLLAEHPEYAMSIYDVHSDGSGCCYSSYLRPIPNMRPNYRMWLVGSPRHLGADLYLINWLESKGIAYDVITDHDLHHEGASLLANYAVMLTGTHPEYWTTSMMTALQTYLNSGGRMMYLGGNGFYWVTAVDRERPHVIEVRRGNASTRAWNSAPGEQYHSATGELGGIWRYRGLSPQQIAGVGFSAMGWDSPTPGFQRQPGSFDPRVAFIFDGIGDSEIIGNFGLVLGGAAGDELDRLDFSLGSPPHTLLLASATGHSRHYLPALEDVLEISASLFQQQDPNVRADMVFFETPNGGAVFSTGSITWCGSLSHNGGENNVSRITQNVLMQFLE
jgi:N,N-dimethylformamidase